jgi:diaminopimelate epimerase
MKFVKYQALGNDYFVIDPQALARPLTPAHIRQICDRHYGPGSDGILLGPLDSFLNPAATTITPTLPETLLLGGSGFVLRIFNPDGSEAEKSGNGLRIFSRYLWDRGLLECWKVTPLGACSKPFVVQTLGGKVVAQVLAAGSSVMVEMGQASFDSLRIPMTGPPRQVVDERMWVANRELRYCAVSMGNPHCVVLCERVSPTLAKELGPWIENERRFPRRTNVQFMQVLDAYNVQIEIWERGAGYTLASGSSSCAAAAAAFRLGLCASSVTVHMPGGQLNISITPELYVTMTGPVAKVYEGEMDLV